MGDADQAALLADGRDRLHGGQAGRHQLFDEDGDQVAVAVFTSSPTMTVRSSGAASRARSAPSMRSWSVIAR